jgi:hypothetical protein
MFKQAVNVAACACAPNPSINNDMFTHQLLQLYINMQTLRRIPYYGTLALLAYMPFHIFLSQWLSTFTGGLGAWKVAKDVVTILLLLFCLVWIVWARAYRKTPYLLFLGLSGLYLGLHIILYLVNKDTSIGVGVLATVYNNRLLWYLMIGMGAVLLTPKLFTSHKVVKIVLIVSTVVCLFGLVQYFLPKDVMNHFGYSIDRGVRPAFFIDDKPDLPRVMSTLRDPNSFGAFLIIPILLIWQRLFRSRNKNQKMFYLGLFGLHGLNLFLTFSRGAWLGAAISLAILSWIQYKHTLTRWLHKYWLPAVTVLLIIFIGAFLLRDQYVIQNIIFHSDETTRAELDSNDLHLKFIKDGSRAIFDKPLGHGPGTAGIVSIQNGDGGLLTENYYLQIGHEVGLFGLILFLTILMLVVKKLSSGAELNTALLASFWGYLLMGFIMHLWTNEAVAVQWWTLAGIAIGLSIVPEFSGDAHGKAKRRLPKA